MLVGHILCSPEFQAIPLTFVHCWLARMIQAHEHGNTGAENVEVEETDAGCTAERTGLGQRKRQVGCVY